MQQAGEYKIRAPRQTVWQALNDPAVLQRCIDGCQSMERNSDTSFTTAVKAKIGPVSALFKADLELADLDPPNSYTINATAKGGAAGFGKGGAKVALAAEGDHTLLTYAVEANVGGKLAQIGSRLIDGAARKMADDFFAKFTAEVEADFGVPAESSDTPAASAYQPSQQWKVWVVIFAILALVLILTV